MEKENELAKIIVDLCLQIHRLYGPGLLERVYETILNYELNKIGLQPRVQIQPVAASLSIAQVVLPPIPIASMEVLSSLQTHSQV